MNHIEASMRNEKNELVKVEFIYKNSRQNELIVEVGRSIYLILYSPTDTININDQIDEYNAVLGI